MPKIDKTKRIQKTKHVLVFTLTCIIFTLGLMVGSYFTDKKLNTISNLESDLRVDTLGMELQYNLLAEEPCKSINITSITDEMYGLSEKIDYMENQLGSQNSDVLSYKSYFSLLQIRHWMLMNKYNEQCNGNNDLIIYFYSNEGDCNRCEEQGHILTYLRRNHQTLYVYAFDINIQNPALGTLKDIHGIGEQTPVLLINDKTFEQFMSKDEILESLNK